jgi:signal transduction histidine kinase
LGRRIPIRAKVAAALAVPLVALVVGAGMGVATSASQASTVTRQAELTVASIGHAGLINTLQDERNAALIGMLALDSAIELEVASVGESRELTDTSHHALHAQIAGEDDTLREDYAEALALLDGLPAVRGRVDAALEQPGSANRETAREVFGDYTDMVAAIFASHDRFSLVVDDAGLRQGDDLVHYSSHATDAVAQLAAVLIYDGTGPGGIDQPIEAAAIAEVARDVTKNNGVVRTKGTGEYAAPAERLLANDRVIGLPELATQAIADGGPVDPVEVLATTPLGPAGGYVEFRDDVVDVLEQRADLLRSRAETQRRWYAGGALAAVLVAVAVAWWVSRSITRPLRDLSRQARLTAEHELPQAVSGILTTPVGQDVAVPAPEPVKVHASDEVGDVAQALNDVHRSALGLAVEQAALRRNIAESYVNLGRRNQNLLNRLIDVVGELERGETDPDRIGHIHKADHLATRIRRNAESLLVLSEAETPPRWRPPVRVLDVVRAALGEIENYQRVVLRSLDPVMIIGGAASDLTHLLAELIENGVKHSPPHELVEIRGRTTPDGYSLAVIDHGLGMTAAEIARANRRLAGEESPTVALSKYLGHFVAAALAARNGIAVRLQGSEVVGIAAIVDLPPTAVAGPGEPVPSLAPAPESVAAHTADVAGGTAPPVWSPPASPSPSPWPPASPVANGGAAPQRPAAPTTTTAPVPPPAPPAATDSPAAAAWSPPSAAPVGDGGNAPLAPGDAIPAGPAVPAVTASGLIRRVRGAQQPGAPGSFGPAHQAATGESPAGEGAASEADAAEIQRFLTTLAAGVQRSLSDNGREPNGPEER